MQNISEIAAKLEKLEKSNRRLKAGFTVLAVVATSAMLLGAAAAKRTIEAERYVFKDATGKERLSLDSTPQGPTCTLSDINGKPSFKVVINRDGFFQMQQNPTGAPPAPAPEKRPAK